jgi:hypothetical protein
MSTQAKFAAGSYRVQDAGVVEITQQGSTRKWAMQCTAAKLVENDIQQVRPEASLSKALDDAADGGATSWSRRTF